MRQKLYYQNILQSTETHFNGAHNNIFMNKNNQLAQCIAIKNIETMATVRIDVLLMKIPVYRNILMRFKSLSVIKIKYGSKEISRTNKQILSTVIT